MFIGALFTTAKLWKQPVFISGYMKTIWYVCIKWNATKP